MATYSDASYGQLSQEETTRYETSSRVEYDDGSETLEVLERIVDKVTMIERWITREADIVNKYIKSYEKMKKRCEEDIMDCKLELLNILRKQEEKTKELKKLNLLVFEVAGESLKRTDLQSKRRVENICRLATNMDIAVQWATQLNDCFSGIITTRVRFFTEEDKMLFLAGEENMFNMGIYVDQDLTRNELKMQMNLEKIADEERANGRVALVGDGTVCIDGVLHTVV